jgi:N-acetylglucosamine kinase-like BadF-type ATPase
MRYAAASYDGRIHSILETLVQDYFQLIEFRELMHRLYVIGMSRSEVASLAPLVITAARQGDEVALDLLDKGAYDLAQMVSAVADKLHFTGHSYELALVGGLFNAGDVVFSPLCVAIQKQLPGCQIVFADCRLPAALPCLH